MLFRISISFAIFALLSSCAAENSDGSDPRTYSSCSITDSSALLASDRAKDISQCWDGVDYKEKSLALDWCAGLVSNYIAENYLVGHSVEYMVSSTNCH
jgi:hypothetical protein